MFFVSSCANVERWTGVLGMHASCVEKRCGAAWRMFSAWISKKGGTISVRWPGVAKRASRLDKSQSAQAFNLSWLCHQVRQCKTMVHRESWQFWCSYQISRWLYHLHFEIRIAFCVSWLPARLPGSLWSFFKAPRSPRKLQKWRTLCICTSILPVLRE